MPDAVASGRRLARSRQHAAAGQRRNRAPGVVETGKTSSARHPDALCRAAPHGHRTVMITGDKISDCRFIAAEAGVDDFLAEVYLRLSCN